MGWLSGAASMAGSVYGAAQGGLAATDAARAAVTSGILEAAFFDDEVGGIIAESARLVGAAEAEAGIRGVKSTTGTAASRVAEIRMAGRRELRTAAQETVLTRHGLAQARSRAVREGTSTVVQGGLSAIGAGLQMMPTDVVGKL